MYDVGTSVFRTLTVRSAADGSLVDADATPALTVVQPDGTTLAAPTVTRSSLGLYSANYVGASAGTFSESWSFTVTGITYVETSSTRFRPPTKLVSLSDAKAFLNLTNSDSDEELREFIGRAESAIEGRCGPLTPAAQSVRVRSNGANLLLPITPVISVESVTPVNGTAIDLTNINTTEAGVVAYLYACGSTFWAPFYDVEYTAGRASAPDDLYGAVLSMIKHLWSTQRGAGSRASRAQQSTANTVPGAAYLWPWAVEQAIAPYVQHGFA